MTAKVRAERPRSSGSGGPPLCPRRQVVLAIAVIGSAAEADAATRDRRCYNLQLDQARNPQRVPGHAADGIPASVPSAAAGMERPRAAGDAAQSVAHEHVGGRGDAAFPVLLCGEGWRSGFDGGS